MRELIRTNDPVLLSWLTARLDGAGIGHAVLDAHTSVMEGSIGAIPRRVMVLDEDEPAARTILDSRPDHAVRDGRIVEDEEQPAWDMLPDPNES